MIAGIAENFGAAFPLLTRQQAGTLAENHCRELGRMQGDFASMSRMSRADLARLTTDRVQISGMETLRSVCADRQPVIFVSPHYGAIAAGCLRLIYELAATRRITICASHMTAGTSRGGLGDLLEKASHAVKIAGNDAKGMMQALTALRKGEVLGILPDMFNPGSRRVVFVPFFGRLTMAMSGTAYLAMKSGSAIVPFYCYREDQRSFRLQVDPPMQWEATGNEQLDTYAITAAILEQFERQLTRRPEPWVYWAKFHKLFEHSAGLAIPEGVDWLESSLSSLVARGPGSGREIREGIDELIRGIQV